MRAHRRLAPAVLAGALVLVGCGAEVATITIQSTVEGSPDGSIVISGDAAQIAQVKQMVLAGAQNGGQVDVNEEENTVKDGDEHVGAKVCAFQRTKHAHTYQVVLYGNIAASECTDFTGIDNDLP